MNYFWIWWQIFSCENIMIWKSQLICFRCGITPIYNRKMASDYSFRSNLFFHINWKRELEVFSNRIVYMKSFYVNLSTSFTQYLLHKVLRFNLVCKQFNCQIISSDVVHYDHSKLQYGNYINLYSIITKFSGTL